MEQNAMTRVIPAFAGRFRLRSIGWLALAFGGMLLIVRPGGNLPLLGTVLMAVGTGHLVGADGVPAMLAAEGMTVTRVQ